jgi:hypothetical protein
MSTMRNEKVVLFYGAPVSHYSYDGIYYSVYFPFEWIIDTKPNTGPKYCQYCRIDGCVDTIFVGYCVDCARNVYQCSRGNGFELGEEVLQTEYIETSATKTYLKHTKYDNETVKNILPNDNDRLSIRSISNESGV